MSKISLSPNASGTATFTLAAPGTNTDRTLTLPDNSGTVQTQLDQGFSFRNRIINGDMRIDQRNNGASVNLTGSSAWPVDRMLCFGRASGTGITGQRSTVAPAGFTNSLLYTITTGATPGGGDYPSLGQIIEGFNAADLGWGSAGAQTVTVSFWARSSVTGTYGFSLGNNAQDRSYVAQYTINAANTWEYKTITIPGDTSGTWLTNNGAGIRLVWDMGFGFGATASPNTWLGTAAYSVSGNVKLAATTGAIFYITGVQLEAGSVATPFERRPYGTELALCQRYYWTGNSTVYGYYGFGGNWPNSGWISFPVTMRTAPTVTFGSATSVSLTNSEAANYIATNGFAYTVNVTSTGTMVRVNPTFATAEL